VVDPTKATIDLVETKIASEPVFDGKLLHVRRDTVRLPNANTATREYIVHPGAVAIVALLDNGDIVLERQFRYPLGRVLVEIPAGKVDPGEDRLETGKRELREETGYIAKHWEHLTTYYPLVAYSDERIDIYLATGLTREANDLDDGEFLEVFTAPLATAAQWVREGKIVDSKSMISILLMEQRLNGRK
jgi:ADP-ribose pyrophosphatase